jgi:signal transduction histidine kinase
MFSFSQNSDIFFLICLGVSLLATCFHSILFAYFRDRLMFNYVLYLFFTCLFIFLRGQAMHVFFSAPVVLRLQTTLNEGLQYISFMLYTNFGIYAMGISKTHKNLYKAWIVLGTIMLFYALTSIVMMSSGKEIPNIFWKLIRVASFSFSFILLYHYIVIRKSKFQKLILLGGVYFLFITFLSFIAGLQGNRMLVFGSLVWLFLGFMGDIIFFSIAIGYWIKNIFDQREYAVLLAAEEKTVIQRMSFEKHEAILEARVDERNRIAMDMHDDLGSGLTRISILSEIAKTQLAEPEKAKTQLESISTYSRELVDSLQDIVWVINAKNDSLAALAAYLRESIVKFFEPFDIQIRFNFPEEIEDIRLSESQRRNLFLVIKETCNNIAKHAGSEQVSIQLTQSTKSFSFIIRDNGRGFSVNETRPMGNGLKNMHNRLSQIGGSYVLVSSPGNGTLTTLQISI